MSAITVYGIWHRFTQQVYVGHSVSTERRFAMHRNSLRRGDHHCIHLQRAWNLYGDGAFDFRPIQVCATRLGTGEFVLCHSVAEAARITGAGRGNVTSCLAGRRTQAAGYLFVKDVQ